MSIGQVTTSTVPLRLAQAYGVQRPAAVAPAAPAAPQAASTPRLSENIRNLVGAVVPGKVDFSGATPAQADGPIPFYRRPGDANEVATALRVGRTLDVEG